MILSEVRVSLCQFTKAGEVDQSGLGRWNSLDVVTENRKIKIMTACRCILSNQTEKTVFMQQLQSFRKIKLELCPIKAFADDIYECLEKSLKQGYKIILSIDENENMGVGRLENLFK